MTCTREPSFTAMHHAWLRHMHATVHPSPIYSDTRSVQLVPEQALERIRSLMDDFSQETTDALSLMAVIRHRVLAERLLSAHERGVRQLVILGAGLDVTGFELPAWANPWRVFEVDTPETQAWKRQQIAAAGWEVPPNLVFAPCDFEQQDLLSALDAAEFDALACAGVLLRRNYLSQRRSDEADAGRFGDASPGLRTLVYLLFARGPSGPGRSGDDDQGRSSR